MKYKLSWKLSAFAVSLPGFYVCASLLETVSLNSLSKRICGTLSPHL